MTTIETVSANQILALRTRSLLHGDLHLANLCVNALVGKRAALRACVRAIVAAESKRS